MIREDGSIGTADGNAFHYSGDPGDTGNASVGEILIYIQSLIPDDI